MSENPVTKAAQPIGVRIFIDVTETLAFDLRTGIQRVVRALVSEERVAQGRFTIKPVVAVNGRFHRLSGRGRKQIRDPEPEVMHVERQGRPTVLGTLGKLILAPFPRLITRLKRQRNARLVDRKVDGLWEGEPIAFRPGDRVVLADSYVLSGALFAARKAQRQGAAMIPVTYDLIPLKPDMQIHASQVEHFRNSVLPGMADADGILTISDWCVQDLQDFGIRKPIGRLHLGYDVAQARVAEEISTGWPEALWATGAPVFLMVGTMTRHKGHHVAIAAFEQLWRDGSDARLLVIGRPGWDEALMTSYNDNPELGKRLFVLHGIPDNMLNTAFRRATAMIQGSAMEGFGLPLIEALTRGTPVIASDIPVFREVAGDAALFYPQADSAALVAAVQQMQLERERWAARAASFSWIGWPEARVQFAEEVDRLAGQVGK